jgi:hypothetical protein
MHAMAATGLRHDESRLADQTGPDAQAHSGKNLSANSWHAVGLPAVLLLSLSLALLLATRWDFSGREIADWRPILERANTTRESGDLHYAKSLYAQAGQLSARNDDWAGLLAAACGMKKLERQIGRRSETTALLLKAMNAAETRQSRSGLVAVANAFTKLGHDSVAAMVLSHVGEDWIQEPVNSALAIRLDCWKR